MLLLADTAAYGIIISVLALLAWTIIELYKGNKRQEALAKETA